MHELQREEVARLNRTVDKFAESMKRRLMEKLLKGYSGWDGAHPAGDLCQQIGQDAARIACTGLTEQEISLRSIDIANRAMFLFYRSEVRQEEQFKTGFARIQKARDAIVQKTNGQRGISGEMGCPACGRGRLQYSVAGVNGHISARCSTDECVSFME